MKSITTFSILMLIAGTILGIGFILRSGEATEKNPPVRSDDGLPMNVFDVMPGQSMVVVPLPDGDGPSPDGKMPVQVDMPIMRISLRPEVPLSMRWRISTEVSEGEKGGKVVNILSEQANESQLVVSHIPMRLIPSFKVTAGERVALVNDFPKGHWTKDDSGQLLWRLVNMGKLGERSIWILVVTGNREEDIADRLILPDKAFSKRLLKFTDIGFIEVL
ncbi:MAG: hypothetical protein KDM63_18905 [Verrucomicrobiae bacterium]|nr:hypothetical protein [Verrucomicrobiae bacterium]